MKEPQTDAMQIDPLAMKDLEIAVLKQKLAREQLAHQLAKAEQHIQQLTTAVNAAWVACGLTPGKNYRIDFGANIATVVEEEKK